MNTTKPTASHVNTGTSISRDELPKPTTSGRVTRLPKLHLEADENPTMTPYGGLVLVSAFLKRFMVAERLDNAVSVLKQYKPYHDSDHILAQALNLYVGGTCIEDLSNLQHSEAARRMMGACRIPDPTTAGDYLRRFDESLNPGNLEGLRRSIDELQCAVWQEKATGRKVTKKNKGKYNSKRSKPEWGVLDVDSKLKELYGVKKEGADFSYKGKWSYKPLLVSMAGTGECLAVRNRSGNVGDADGAAKTLSETLDYVRPNFQKILVRADSGFDWSDMRRTCEEHGAYVATVGREFPNRPGIAEAIPESEWQPFRTRAARMAEERRRSASFRSRQKKQNLRRKRARERRYSEKQLIKQWIAEVPFKPPGSDKSYRLVIRRQLIQKRKKGQTNLFVEYRYRYVVTNLPSSVSTERVVDLVYERCDQENMIEQMGTGIAAWRMPVGEFAGNCAWLEIARLAWNLRMWIAQLVLPDEVIRWEWKRFRNAFVFLAAEVVKRSRQIWVRFHGAHRFLSQLLSAHESLQL